MKKYFTYRADGSVALISDKKQEDSVLNQKKLEVSEEDMKKIVEGWTAQVKDDVVVVEESQSVYENKKRLSENEFIKRIGSKDRRAPVSNGEFYDFLKLFYS